MSARHVLPGARDRAPLQQGDLSQLCGLYSILNAFQLALYPELTAPRLKRLFLRGIQHLAQTRQLRQVVGVGMEEDIWLSAAHELIGLTGSVRTSPLKLRRVIKCTGARNRRSSLLAIQAALDRGNPVLTYFGGALDHYTVISGYTEARLLLFDSLGMRWLKKEGIGFSARSPRRHWMQTSTVLELSRG